MIVDDENNQDGSVSSLRTVPPGFARGLRLPGEEGNDDEALTALAEISGTKRKQETEEVSLLCSSPSPHLNWVCELARHVPS